MDHQMGMRRVEGKGEGLSSREERQRLGEGSQGQWQSWRGWRSVCSTWSGGDLRNCVLRLPDEMGDALSRGYSWLMHG
jgi:hypothetical protein